MTILERLTERQKEDLIEIRNSYLKLMEKKGEIPSLRARVIQINDELRDHEKSIKPNQFG